MKKKRRRRLGEGKSRKLKNLRSLGANRLKTSEVGASVFDRE